MVFDVRLAYLVSEPVDPRSGVGRKLIAQVAAWRSFGVEALLAVMTHPGCEDLWHQHLEGVETARVGGASLLQRELRRQSAGVRLARSIRRWNPDFVYVRYGPLHVGEELVRRFKPFALEVNSDDLAEYRRQKPLYLYHRASRWRMLRSCAVAFAPTQAIADTMGRALRCPIHVISNGVDLSNVRHLPANEEGLAVAFLAGSDSPRQGVDKVVRLADRLPGVLFHVIGPVPKLSGVHGNIVVHGPLDRSEYEGILRSCDVGLGTLALHRQGMAEAAPLKVREYLASGLPVVLAHTDPDRAVIAPWALEIPNSEDNVDRCADSILQFVERFHGVRVPPSVASEFDHAVKESRRLEILRGTLAGTTEPTS